MTYRLGIDTSTDRLSVCLVHTEESHLLASLALDGKKRHGETLLAAIDQLLQLTGIQPSKVSSLVVGAGPGSYTGLRIGMTAAKVWAATKAVDLYVVSSLALLASRAETSTIIPVMDARRGTAYTGVYRCVDGVYSPVVEDTHQDFKAFLDRVKPQLEGKVTLVGQEIDAFAEVFRTTLPEVEVEVLTHYAAYPTCESLLKPGFQSLIARVEDVGVLTPNYAHATLAEQEWAQNNPQEGSQDEAYIEHLF